jgi:hypothetical protein
MKSFAANLNLPPVWWWSAVGAVAVIALIFLAIGSTAAFLITLLCAAGIAALAVSVAPHDETTRHEDPPAEHDEADSTA